MALIIGIAGACRREEMAELSIDDINDLGAVLMVTLRDTKTKIDRTFTVVDNKKISPTYMDLYKQYVALRPSHINHRRFFIFYKNGKCSVQVVGKNTFGGIPSMIATFLQLPDAKLYTGHCFRRSSASLLANSGADITCVKQHGGWRSTNVAEGYIVSSTGRKLDTAERILLGEPSTSGIHPGTSNRAEATITSAQAFPTQASSPSELSLQCADAEIGVRGLPRSDLPVYGLPPEKSEGHSEAQSVVYATSTQALGLGVAAAAPPQIPIININNCNNHNCNIVIRFNN